MIKTISEKNKRIFILVCCMAALCLPIVFGESATASGNVLPGDFNTDTVVDSDDVPYARKYLIGTHTVDDQIADANEDGKNNIKDLVSLKKTCLYPFKYGTYQTYNIEDFTAVIGATGTNNKVIETTVDGYRVIQATFEEMPYPGFQFQSEQLKDLAKFDYFTIRYKVDKPVVVFGIEGTSGNIYNVASSTIKDGDWTVATWRKDRVAANGTTTGQYVFDKIANTGILNIKPQVTLSDATGEITTITVAEIVGGYDKITYTGEPVTFLTKFGLSSDEFTATFTANDGTTQAITDKTAFTPDRGGVLTLNVEKEGYRKTTLKVDINTIFQYGLYETDYIEDFDSVNASLYGNALEVKEVTENGTPALQAVMQQAWPKFSIKSEQLKDLSKFDYVTIKYKLSGTVSSLGLTGMEGSVYNKAVDTVTDNNGWIYATWRKDNQKAINASNSNPQGPDIFNYIEANGKIEICLYVGADVTLTVAEITGGYDDLLTDCTTPINLTTQYGLLADEFTATFTPTGGTAQTVEDETAFVPTGNGTLTLDIGKEGYLQTTVSVNVKKAFAYGVYSINTKTDFTDVYCGNASLQKLTTAEVKEVNVDNCPALQLTLPQNNASMVIKSEQLKDLENFDYLTIKYKITDSQGATVNTGIGLAGTQTYAHYYNQTTTPVKTVDGWTVRTWRKDQVNASSGNAVGKFIFDYIKNNGAIGICFQYGNGNIFTIAEIAGGYDSVSSDGVTAIDLATKYGDALVSAVYTPTGGTAQEVSDLTSFVGATSGTLTLTFNKEGYIEKEFVLDYTVSAE